MTTQRFFKQLIVLTLIAIGTAFGLHFVPTIAPYQNLSWISILAFIVFSTLLFRLGVMSANSANNHLFSQIFLIATVVKMGMCILIIWIYQSMVSPHSHLFIIPFFTIYIFYTGFEIHFLTRLANNN